VLGLPEGGAAGEGKEEKTVSTQTVEEAMSALKAAIEREHGEKLIARLSEGMNGSAPSQRRTRRVSAGRARQIAAMKRYWANRRRSK